MIQVDISNIWGGVSLPDLLAVEREIFQSHWALTEEQPKAGWMELPEEEEIARILAAAERIREESQALIVIHGGNSGAKAVLELLRGANRDFGREPRIFFAGDSFSTRAWQTLMHAIEGKALSLCVIGGEETESKLAFRSLKWMLERKYGTDEARQRIYAVTCPGQDSLAQMAREEGWETFHSPETNFLSAAELLPLAVAGIDIRGLLRSAAMAKEVLNLRSLENPAWLYAAARRALYRKGREQEVLACFEPDFAAAGRWWQELFAGVQGAFPIYGEYPRDLRIYEGLLRQGKAFETVIRFDPPEQKVQILEDVRNRDGLNDLAGKTLDRVEADFCLEMTERHSDEGVPVVSIESGELDEENLGALIWFFRLSCALSGE
jgi:glucose-6-phosphate isomerase